VRPAVSVRRTTALDEFNIHSQFPRFQDFGDYSLDSDEFSSIIDNADANGADLDFYQDRIAPITDSFHLDFDHLAGDNHGAANEFEFDDFIHQDEVTQSAPEVQSSDSLAETTAGLQPPTGASTYGCDDGGIAVGF